MGNLPVFRGAMGCRFRAATAAVASLLVFPAYWPTDRFVPCRRVCLVGHGACNGNGLPGGPSDWWVCHGKGAVAASNCLPNLLVLALSCSPGGVSTLAAASVTSEEAPVLTLAQVLMLAWHVVTGPHVCLAVKIL